MPLTLHILITKDQIAQRVQELGKRISQDYQGKELLLVTLLRGSFVFVADLIREMELDVRVDFMRVSSYKGQQSTGEVHILSDLEEPIGYRDVLIVEDIVDTGVTLSEIYNLLKSRHPLSLEICTFLDKPSKRQKEIDVKYVGFELEDNFVVGYGLDEDERYRQLPYVGEFRA